MIDAAALDIFLGKKRVGTIARLDGDASIFTFDEVYLSDQERPTLSLAYKDANGEIIADTRSYRTKIEPFFSNLLPEGTLRDYLARRAGPGDKSIDKLEKEPPPDTILARFGMMLVPAEEDKTVPDIALAYDANEPPPLREGAGGSSDEDAQAS